MGSTICRIFKTEFQNAVLINYKSIESILKFFTSNLFSNKAHQLNRFFKIIKFINQHPLASKQRLRAYWRFLYWQISQRIWKPHEIVYSFTPQAKIILKKGLIGGTGNIYVGLHDFSEMGFLLHFLREEDLFADIGANVGTYTILASAQVGAKTIAFEPSPSTFKWLEKNIQVNLINQKVKAFQIGLGEKKGTLCFTNAYDAENHVMSQWEKEENTIEINIESFDDLCFPEQIPNMVKIDVEGFESEVLKGMKSSLTDIKLNVIIIELNGSGYRYDFDEKQIHVQFLELGFQPFEYNPYKRKLTLLSTFGSNNTIYIRDVPFVEERLKAAEKIKVFGEWF